MAARTLEVQFSPGTGPFDTPSWITLTAAGPHGNRVRSAEWTWGKERDDEAFPPGQATLTLYNHDRLFDPDNTSGTYSGDLRPRVPFRIRTTDGEDLFYGFVEDGWEQTYAHPADGYCTVRLVDILAVVEGVQLPGVFEHAVLSLSPDHYWPLTDAGVSDLGATPRPGTPEENPSFGGGELFPGLGPSVEFDGEASRIDISRSPVISDVFNASMMAVFRTAVPADTNTQHPIFTQSDGNALAKVTTFNLFVHTDGTPRFTSLANSSGVARGLDLDVADGEPHLVFAQHEVGVEAGIGIDTAVITDFDVTVVFDPGGNGVAIGGTPYARPFYTENMFPGEISHVAIWNSVLTEPQRQTIVDALPCLNGDRSDEHIAWALDRLGITASMRNLDEGRSIMGAARTAGVDALEFLRRVEATEQGLLHVDHQDGGKVRFVERFAPWLATRSTTPQAVFSDDPTDTTAVRVEPGTLVVEANGIRSVVNTVTVRWTDGEETADDTDSVDAYGPRARSIDTLASGANQAKSLAQWASRLAAEPSTRVRGLGINPGAAVDGFDAAVGLRVNDLVTYRSQPSSTGSVTTRNLLILGGSHRVEGKEWTCSFFTSQTPADLLDPFILGTSELDGTDVLAY